MHDTQNEQESLTVAEALEAQHSMINKKAPGPRDLSTELLIHASIKIIEILTEIYEDMMYLKSGSWHTLTPYI